jgi:cell division protein FtsW (lipid II flippase)
MMVYTGYTSIYLYILVYQNNIGHIQAYTVTCYCYIFHAEARFHYVCASYDTHPKHCMT